MCNCYGKNYVDQLPNVPYDNKTRSFKTVFLGDINVGKSTLEYRIARGKYMEEVPATISSAFRCATRDIDGIPVVLQLWDTAGQERYKPGLPKIYYRGTHVVLVMYDITSSASFNSVDAWIKELKNGGSEVGNSKIQDYSNVETPYIVVIGNKIDLESQRQVSYEQGKSYCQDNDVEFIEISILQNIDCDKLINLIYTKCFDRIKQLLVKINK